MANNQQPQNQGRTQQAGQQSEEQLRNRQAGERDPSNEKNPKRQDGSSRSSER